MAAPQDGSDPPAAGMPYAPTTFLEVELNRLMASVFSVSAAVTQAPHPLSAELRLRYLTALQAMQYITEYFEVHVEQS